MPHDHGLDPEYLYPADAEVVRLYEGADGAPRLTVAVPCPECEQALELDAEIERVDEADLELPLEDATDLYD